MTRAWVVALGAWLAAGCARPPAPAAVAASGGSPARGRQMLAGWGCGSCHTIPGVPGANSAVAPPLTSYAARAFVAGQAPNTPENLVRWIMHPQSVVPLTAMPDLGAPEPIARDMAAYLYTLR